MLPPPTSAGAEALRRLADWPGEHRVVVGLSGGVDSNALRLERNARGVHLRFTPEWAGAHPRTVYLLQQEALAWARSGVLELTLDAPLADSPVNEAA